jgi:hypothetical protein
VRFQLDSDQARLVSHRRSTHDVGVVLSVLVILEVVSIAFWRLALLAYL